MTDKEKLREAVLYFKAREGFNSIFLQLVEKYRSYGRFGGKIVIKNPSLSEKKHLSGFLGKDYSRDTLISLEVSKFEEALDNSLFQGVDLKGLVECYHDITLKTKKEEKAQQIKEQECFFDRLGKEIEHEYVMLLKEAIEKKVKGTKGVYDLYNKDRVQLKEILKNIYRSFLFLPENGYVRLPLFASETTGNPHYFDINTHAGKMFLQCLQVILFQTIEKEIISNPTTEEITEIMDFFGVSRDDVNNNVSVYGMIEIKNGQETLLSRAINQRKKVMAYPLRELEDLKDIQGVGKKVFVIENSGVYSSLVDECLKEDIGATIVCSSGQLNLSVWILLEKFVKKGNKIYYSGDHDPEGILMANRLKGKFQDMLVFWNFNVKSYVGGLSQETISNRRLKQLNAVKYEELKDIIKKMNELKICGYQEKQKNRLFQEMKRIIM